MSDDETREPPTRKRRLWPRRRIDARRAKGVSDGAAEVIAAIAHDLQKQLSGVATVDLVYEAGNLADLTVEPVNQSASPISVVGIGAGFVISLKTGTWEIDNSTKGRQQLKALISDTVEGRIAAPRRLGFFRTNYPGYR
jgi:hypothetical protein